MSTAGNSTLHTLRAFHVSELAETETERNFSKTMRRSPLFCLLAPLAATAMIPHLATAQACPITIRHIDARSRDVIAPTGTHPPYLKITYHNDSPATITRIEFQVHFAGAIGQFASTHPVKPGAGDVSAWPDGAFIRLYGDEANMEAHVEKILFSDGTSWIDDGTHVCSKEWVAEASHQREGGDQLGSVPSFGDGERRTTSLLVPANGNTVPAPAQEETEREPQAPAEPVTLPDWSKFRTGPPPQVTADNRIVYLPLEPILRLEKLPEELTDVAKCPVIPEYIDLGDAGRIHTTLANRSAKAVHGIVLTVASQGNRQTITKSDKITGNSETNETWETTPPVQKTLEATVQVERFTYPDGKIWNDFGRGTCTVSSVRGRLKEERPQAASAPAASTTPAQVPPSSASSTAQKAVAAAPALTLPQFITGVTPASALATPAKVETPEKAVQAVPITTPATITHEPVNEEATAEGTRRFAPLIAEKKASICTVSTTPAGAEVTLDGKKLGQTPMVFVMVKKVQARQLTLSLPGYHSVQYSLFPDGNPVPLTVHLSKEATAQSAGQ